MYWVLFHFIGGSMAMVLSYILIPGHEMHGMMMTTTQT